MMMRLTQHEDGVLGVALSGRLDVNGVDMVESRFTSAATEAPGGVLVDMSETEFVASLGLRMFVAVARTLHGSQRRMVLYACQPQVAEVLEMAALDALFPVVPSEASARAALVAQEEDEI